jgi:hypothetical protein
MPGRPIVAVSLVLLAAVAFGDSSWTSFEFEAYNREYVDVRSHAQWEQGGPIRMTVSSPSHRLVIREHSVDLQPEDDGLYRARVRVSFSGEGDLRADLNMVGAGTRLEDHVVVPLQEVEVYSRVRFSRAEDGYDIETIELPEAVDVRIESRLGQQLVDTCKSTLRLLGVKCAGLDAAFSKATVPLPPPGETYFVPDEQLSKSERRRLSRFLEQND